MKKYKDLLRELPSKTVVVTFGQFNPPSVGHELLVKVVRKLASQRKADHNVFVSSVQDKKNPLEISKKIQYLETLFPSTKFIHRELTEAVNSLKKYKSVTVVTPTECLDDYKKVFKKAGIEAEYVQAGAKCPDSDDKLVKLATKGEYQSFRTSLPTSSREMDAKRLMNDVRVGLDLEPIKEQINLVKDELREQYFRGEIFNMGDIVESDNEVYRIIKRGSNHLLLQNEAGLKISKWIQDVQLTEREFMLDEKQLEEATGSTATSVVNKEAEKAKADTAKAQQALKFSAEKEALAKKQEREATALSNLKTEEVVDKNSKYNIAKSVMSLSDFRKSMSQSQPMGDAEEKELQKKVEDGLIGNTHMDGGHPRKLKVKYHLGEASYNHDDNRTGFAKRSAAWHADGGANDEGHPPEKFKAKSLMDRPHTVHIDGKPWKKFSNGHQAHAAAKTLRAKGKEANAVAHFREEAELEEARMSAAVKLQRAFEREQAKSAASRQRAQELLAPKKEEPKPVKEETGEQSASHKVQLKRFKDQAKEAKLGLGITEAAYKGLEAEDKPGKKATEFKGSKGAVVGKTVEGWKDEQKPVKEEFEDINEDELATQVEADLDALTEEDFLEAYDDNELAIIDEETGEEIESLEESSELMEVLSRQERIKARARMRRSQAKRERREKIALRQFSSTQVANKRARRMAVSAMKKRLLKGRNPSKVSVGEKERVERFIAQRKKIVDRLSARMVTRVKQVEKARMSHKKFTKPNNGVTF